MKLLLVEDHQEISNVIFEFFELKGHNLDYTRDGKQGLSLALTNHYDLIILDIMLPGISGLTLCQQLRAQGVDTPVLMLTARDEQEDILSGFEHGADDYLIKPFDLRILEARAKALHQRKTGRIALKELNFGDITLDLTTHSVTREGCNFQLNQTLFILLKTLILRAPEIATREELILEIWGDDEPDDDLLRNHVYRLRTLVDKPFKHSYIKTIPKVGYQLKQEG